MPQQAALRLIKRCRLYQQRGNFKPVPPVTRGLYILYRDRTRPRAKRKKIFEVVYIGVAGVAKEARSGISSRLKSHYKKEWDWTHCSLFEVHDNVVREDILELEGLLLRIFRHDPRIKLSNKQLGGKVLKKLSGKDVWK